MLRYIYKWLNYPHHIPWQLQELIQVNCRLYNHIRVIIVELSAFLFISRPNKAVSDSFPN
jgi:hypothetical protein